MGAAGIEVVHAISRRAVDQASAVVGGGVVGQVDRAEPIVACVDLRQRVLELDAAEFLAQRDGHHIAGDAVARQALFHQRCGQHQQAALGVDERVLERRVQVERLVRGDRPGGGGPDHRERILGQRGQAEGGRQLVRLSAQEGHVQGLAALVGVLDLELGQRRRAVEAPVNRLQSAVDETAFDHPLEGADLAGLVGEVHRAIGVVPVGQHAQALEIGHLLVDLLGRESAALGLHVVAAQLAAVLLFDRVLDRQAVTVPAWDKLGVKAGELPGLDHHVLEHLVDGMPHVDLAVGVRRAVGEDELGCIAARVAQLLVKPFVLPLLDPAGLALGQVAAHRERRVRQVQGGAVVGRCFGVLGVGHGSVTPVGPARSSRGNRLPLKAGGAAVRGRTAELVRAASERRALNSVARVLAVRGGVQARRCAVQDVHGRIVCVGSRRRLSRKARLGRALEDSARGLRREPSPGIGRVAGDA